MAGRNNWLFADTVKGAKASANLCSLTETAKANGLEPYHYLRYVFTELPQTESIEQIEAFPPGNINVAILSTSDTQKMADESKPRWHGAHRGFGCRSALDPVLGSSLNSRVIPDCLQWRRLDIARDS